MNKIYRQIGLLLFGLILVTSLLIHDISITKESEAEKELLVNTPVETAIKETSDLKLEHTIQPNHLKYEAVPETDETFELSSLSYESYISYEIYEIPEINTDFKAFCDYQCITDTTSIQWELQQSAYTDEYGLRKIDEAYLVAMGSYYTTHIGDKFEITLDNETTFIVIVGDFKQDIHTDEKNQYSPVYKNNGEFYGANILEFIVDTNILDSMVEELGTISYYDKFGGNIIKIAKLVI